MRAAAVTFTPAADVSYAQVDYARVVKAQGAAVVSNFADEEDEAARQPIIAPAGDVVLGIGPNASPTRFATEILAEQGIRVLSTVGTPSTFEPFDRVDLAERQAHEFATADGRDRTARALYAGRFVDSPLLERSTVTLLRSLDIELTAETYGKYVVRFKPSRFHRHPAGTDFTNRALTAAEGYVLRAATDVCRLLNVSPALGVVQTGSRLSFAQDLADSFKLDVTIPVGFQVGAEKLKNNVDMNAALAFNLHHHRLVPRMIELVISAFGGR